MAVEREEWGIIMLRVEINEIDGRKAIEIINQTVSCFFGKRIRIGKEEGKTVTVWGWHDTMYRKSQRWYQKTTRAHNEVGKVEGYKINTQKSIAFLHTNNERTEREIKATIPFIIASKRIKYLWINLAKEAKDLYSEN